MLSQIPHINTCSFIEHAFLLRPDASTTNDIDEATFCLPHESFIDSMVYVMEGFNLPIPDEGGPLHKLKAIGLKAGTGIELPTTKDRGAMVCKVGISGFGRKCWRCSTTMYLPLSKIHSLGLIVQFFCLDRVLPLRNH